MVSGSECYVHLVRVLQLLEVRQTSELDHWGRTTHQYERAGLWSREMVTDHLVIDETCAVLPGWTGREGERERGREERGREREGGRVEVEKSIMLTKSRLIQYLHNYKL